MTVTIAIYVAGVIALAAAAVELLARYRDNPLRALLSLPSVSYMLVNGLAGAGTAWWLDQFFPKMVSTPAGNVDPIKLAIVAGFGSLVVLRTSVMKLRVASGQDISIGPAVIIDQLLSVIDRGVDRSLAGPRAKIVAELAEKFVFDRDNLALVSLCLGLLQNPTASEEQETTSLSRSLAGRSDISPKVKKMILLLALLGVVGENVLRQAVMSLQEPDTAPPPGG